MSIKDFSNILGADLAKKVYDDTLSPAAQQVGKTLEDLVKGLRLFTYPFQLAATYQDRLTKHLDKVREAVPEERQ